MSYLNILNELPKAIREEVEKYISENKLSEEEAKKFVENVYKNWLKKCFEPQEAIGILTTQSISEPATQATMRTFHLAGGALGFKVTLGLPRLIELFDARKNISSPVMYIYLKKEYNNEENAFKLANEIVERKIMDEFEVALNLSNFTIEISSKEKEKVEKLYKMLKKKFKVFEVEKQTDKVVLIPKKEYSIKQLRMLKDRIEKLTFEGVPGIERAIVLKEKDEYIIQTLGSNLKEILKYEMVDETRTYCNNPHEIAEVFGIEAARSLLIMEIYKTLQQQGLDVDLRFLSIVADAMCFTGEIQAIGRHGVAGRRASVLAKAGFEETVKHLVNAAIRNQKDNLLGPFENLMIGNLVPIGTGRVKLIYHERNKQ